MADEKKSFWETLPGILTGVAAVITAVAGLVALFIKPADKKVVESKPEVSHTRVAEATERPRRIQIDGTWRDLVGGTLVKITQHGNQITSETYQPGTGVRLAAGDGLLQGNNISGTNRWFDGNVYTADLTISDDGRSITGTFRHTFSGQTGAVNLLRT